MKRFLYVLLLVFVSVGLAACSGDESGKPDTSTVMATPVLGTPVPSQPTTLNAGEIDDNAQWEHFTQYRTGFLQVSSQMARDVDVSQRQIITVSDGQRLPVLGARVLVYGSQELLAETRTYATGHSLFFPSAWTAALGQQAFRVIVQKNDTTVEFMLDPAADSEWQVTLDAVQQPDRISLDVLFLLDATGSMADEITQLQTNILDISSNIAQLPGDVDVRYALVAYRDRGDDYVTRAYDFVPDVSDFQAQLNAVEADGGGDNPESLNEALHVAIQDMAWRQDDTIKLVFLVADAPPHLDYPNDYDYSQEMVAAAWKGIKIHPIASSGLKQDGEFIFRQIAQYSMGHFIFLTYQQGNAGEPGAERPDLAAGQDNYTVEQLDDLVLELITDEITALNTPVASNGTLPQLAPVDPQPVHDLPTVFALARSPLQTAYAEPQQAPVQTNPSEAEDGQFAISLPAMLAIAVTCLGLGYVMSTHRRLRKRKRKIDELLFNARDYVDEGD